MVESAYTILDFAAGTGMLSHGFKLGLELIGLRGIVVGGVERDAAAAIAFLEGMELAQGFRPPLWDDAKTFVGRRDRGLESVDAFCAGYPCQPFSSAGKRLGARDPRHLWPAVRRTIARVKPRIVFLENVDGHVSLGLWKVLRDLERLGYQVTCGVFSAEEVGAPHLRKRLFILGRLADAANRRGRKRTARSRSKRSNVAWAGSQLGYSDVTRANAHAAASGSRRAVGEPGRQLGDTELPGVVGTSWLSHADEGRAGVGNGFDELAHGNSERRQQESGSSPGYEAADGQSRRSEPNGSHEPICGVEELGDGQRDGQRACRRSGAGIAHEGHAPVCIFPPHRTDYRRWAELAALGLDPSYMPAIESGFSVVADGLAPPSDLLRLGGNGVCPLTAAWALLNLACCLLGGVESEEPATVGGNRQLRLF